MQHNATFGFYQEYENERIKLIQFYRDGSCLIHYHSGDRKYLQVGCDVGYNQQFNTPISDDGTLLFLSSWEKGLTAYDIENDCVRWQYKKSRIKNLFVFGNTVSAIRFGCGLLRFNIHTGELLDEIKSPSVEKTFQLSDRLILIDRIRGKLCLADVAEFTVIRQYSPKAFNPNAYLCSCITDAYLDGADLYIHGFEYKTSGDENIWFDRKIDTISV